MSTPPSSRLHVLIAREAPRAVVLRRGPSKQVLLSKWDLATDAIEPGQWIKARIREECCDLSPRGTFLVYSAITNKGPLQSWTAISKPPYWSALVVFATKMGGGGVFFDETNVGINYGLGPLTPTSDSLHPEHFKASLLYGYTGPPRMIRDGWVKTQTGKSSQRWKRSPTFVMDPPEIHVRSRPGWPAIVLERRTVGFHEVNGPFELLDYALTGAQPKELGRLDWADWSADGDLLFAKEGQLYRTRFDRGGLGEPKLVYDFRPLKFWTQPPSPEALSIGRSRGRKRTRR